MDEARLRRIGFVTRHYSELRGGVTRALWAPCILAVALIEYFLIARHGLPGVVGLTNIVAWTGIGIVVWWRTRRWLDRRFGRVQSGSLALDLRVIVSDLWDIGSVIAWMVAIRFDDSYGFEAGVPSAKFLFLAAAALWFCVRLRPHSLHYLVPVVVALGFAMPFGELRGEAAIDRWEFQGFIATGLAWSAAGLIDLMMLFKAMPRRPQEGPVAVDA